MKKIIYLFAALAVLAACSKENFSTGSGKAPQGESGTVSGEVVIKFDASLSDMLDNIARGVSTRSGVNSVDELMDIIGGYELERVFPYNEATEARTREAGLHLWYVVRFDNGNSTEDVVSRLSQVGEVQKVSPVRVLRKAYNTDRRAIPFIPVGTKAASAEDLYPYQWNFRNEGWSDIFAIDGRFTAEPSEFEDVVFDEEAAKAKFVTGSDINLEASREIYEAAGNSDIIVAVLDEGVFISHPDLKNSIWTNEKEVWGSHQDNDGNGYEGDRYGYDFVKNTGKISWDAVGDTGHGTHVAGVIAASNDNQGIRSIAGGKADRPGVKIMSCQIFSGSLAATNTLYMVRAIKYATDNGAVVLQCSWGYTSGAANVYENGAAGFRNEEEWMEACPLEKEILDYFRHNAGSPDGPISGGIPVFASGNEYAPLAGFPGASTGCVSVAAVAADGTPASYTNYGKGTTIAAPGGDQDYYYEFGSAEHKNGAVGCILSTLPYHVSASGYGYMEGTSMACPHVSGVIALGLSYALEQRRHFSADEFLDLLYSSCTPLEYGKRDEKLYYKYQTDVGFVQPQKLELNAYNGTNMGAGLVNTEAFLSRISGGGVDMHIPNLYIALDGSKAVSPSRYMDGEQFTVKVENAAVAVASAGDEEGAELSVAKGQPVVFKAVGTGMTKATVSSDAGGSQEFYITVRKNAGGPGWL